jgi:hypothetical protein
VYHHFHRLFSGVGGGVDAAGGVVVIGAIGVEVPSTAPAGAVGACCVSTFVEPPDVENDPDCHTEEDDGSCGVECTGALEPGLLVVGRVPGEEYARDGEEEVDIKLIPP